MDELGYVSNFELAQDVRAVEFHGSMADLQVPRSFLAGGAHHDLRERNTFSRRERVMPREWVGKNIDCAIELTNLSPRLREFRCLEEFPSPVSSREGEIVDARHVQPFLTYKLSQTVGTTVSVMPVDGAVELIAG